MRCLNRNKQKFYYALYSRETDVVDGSGFLTGEHKPSYSDPVVYYANISAGKGTTDVDMFGIASDHTRTILIDDVDCPIAETSILWVDTIPILKEDGSTDTKNDYVLSSPPAKSLNNVVYAIKKVDVS